MLLSIKNVGKIEYADIEIDTITVVAGENNSGKSTIGKILFCVFNSFYNIDEQINAEKVTSVARTIETNDELRFIYGEFGSPGTDILEIAKSIITRNSKLSDNASMLIDHIKERFVRYDICTEKQLEKVNFENVANKVINILKISDKEILETILRNKLRAEFDMQINNLYYPDLITEVTLKIKNFNSQTIQVINNEKVKIVADNISLNTEAIYMDNPFSVDDVARSFPYRVFRRRNTTYDTHKEHLQRRLSSPHTGQGAVEEIIVEKKLSSINDKLNSISVGDIIFKASRDIVYKESETDLTLNILNVSAGIKAFAIIKTLLQNGCLEERGTIILDEPEIHLHPEWQLVFAELIVLIQKEFNMHVLLTTHSPYFLEAIEVYSQKHGVEKCKYYLAKNTGKTSTITDVSENIEAIYEKLAKPLQTLENKRYSDD